MTHQASPSPATTPRPPYYAVIFTSVLGAADPHYAAVAARMVTLAAEQPGFLGVESAREGAFGITVSYWRDEAAIRAWREQVEHAEARRLGREKWYARYSLRVARVERAYAMGPEATTP